MYCNVGISCVNLTESSDRNIKTGIEPVSPADILNRVAALPISPWAFTNAVSTRHLGPMAQDFRASFGLGEDDKTISSRDVASVALAAIQGLNQKLEQTVQEEETQIAELKQHNQSLAARLAKLEKVLEALAGKEQAAQP